MLKKINKISENATSKRLTKNAEKLAELIIDYYARLKLTARR